MSTYKVSYDIGPSCGYETFLTKEAAEKFVELLYDQTEGMDEDDYCIDYWEVVE